MPDAVGARIFTALHAAAAAELGPDDPCTRALAAAVGGAPDRLAPAQAALGALPPDRLARLMAAAHRTLALDPATWLGLWQGGPRQ